VLLTVLGAAVAALGASTYLSFRYWENEALASAERQALLAAASTQATLESAIRLGRLSPAHHALTRLREEGHVTTARVYGRDGRILISADPFEEGTRASSVFIPDAAELPRAGLTKPVGTGGAVRAYLPVSIPEPAVLEVEFSVAPTMAAMERGARLGMGLMAVSLLAVGIVVVTMFEREVVAPLHRMDVLLRAETGRGGPRNELLHLERSVTELLEKGRAVEARAADQDRRLAAQEGLAQVGELAAEMAHEFKRPLASIQTAVSLLQQEYELDEGGREMLGAVHQQLDRLHETMQDLFSLAKPLVMEGEAVDLTDVLDEALAGLAGIAGIQQVEVDRAYGHERILVRGDARRLAQAFLNVLGNAVEAMPDGGHLTVSATLRPDASVEVSITDTGHGLDPEAVERALRPFYSTKPLGTGLGLPLVARIVSAHRGGLAIESRPKHGTTVRITLRVVPQPATTGA
jgi:signal transduction histidine kinase